MPRWKSRSGTVRNSYGYKNRIESYQARELMQAGKRRFWFFVIGSWLVPLIPFAGIFIVSMLTQGVVMWLYKPIRAFPLGLPVYSLLLLLSYLIGWLRGGADPIRPWTAIPTPILFPVGPVILATMFIAALDGGRVPLERLLIPFSLAFVLAGIGGVHGARRFRAKLGSMSMDAIHR